MSENRIDAIIDDHRAMYAYAYLQRSGNYGHMTVRIFMAGNYTRPSGEILIDGQAGSSYGDDVSEIYGHKFGFQTRHDCCDLSALEVATKLMRKIDKGIIRLYGELGATRNFPEFAQRILICAGVSQLIIEPHHFATGGAMRDKALVKVGADSAHRLELMANALIKEFGKRACHA